MNDWWNDPPDEEPWPICPACKDGIGDYLTGTKHKMPAAVMMLECDDCGYRWIEQIPQDPGPEDYL